MSTKIPDVVLYDSKDGVATVTMNRPHVHNAFNRDMSVGLGNAMRSANEDPSVHVVVLTGAGVHFSAGYQFDDSDMYTPKEHLELCYRWRDLTKPTIAMVQGSCSSAGLMLAWVCDLIVAADQAVFSDAGHAAGSPGADIATLVYELNARLAKEFLFLGERMSAPRAYEMGLVNRVVPREFLSEETVCIAQRISKMRREDLVAIKLAVNRAEDLKVMNWSK